MKVVNNVQLREKEKQSFVQMIQDELEKKKIRKQESKKLYLTVIPDWRILGELNPIVTAIFDFELKERRKEFLKHAIEERNQLNQLIVEPYEPSLYAEQREKIEIETDKQLIETLSKEAGKAHLTINEYVRAILYTTALNKNNERKERQQKFEEKQKENRTVTFQGFINQKLINKLEEKYPTSKEQREAIVLFGKGNELIGEKLLLLAKEYFDIE